MKFKIGDRVANKDPQTISYNWHGVIVRFSKQNPDVCYVKWKERVGFNENLRLPFNGDTITARVEDLRKIE